MGKYLNKLEDNVETENMVCAIEEEDVALCIVRDYSGTSTEMKITLHVSSSTTVREFVREVCRRYNFEPDSVRLVAPSKIDKPEQSTFVEDNDELLKDMGVSFYTASRNLFIVEGLNNSPPRLISKDDDLELGASASPEESCGIQSPPPPPEMPSLPATDYSWKMLPSPSTSLESSNRIFGFRGLVNQAMTCYLNSLLQALYMTPEFRNALYNYKFDRKVDESKSIPYQLQKLFLNLQTSSQTSVHTTELTRSFGWDSSEAWQQHDIQELCRVMFEALEQEFNGTDQADLINRLYGGKMIDYVKCLECGTEKFREDTFQDIPLPIRPFGSTVAYSSVEEALRGFVQPETLDGNNQYFCERCNKKCNAHKGLKFAKFPYLLTLHLMRFDFDYNTMHRVKLNDRVLFPEVLNLNSFVSTPSANVTSVDKEDGSEGFPEEITCSSGKCDDSSTTDSGSAIDDDNVASSSDLNSGEVDEGIDMSSSHDEKTRRHKFEKGPFIYELFAVMVHSGSASGGHYYVLIKDFSAGEWYCFNDQTVSRVTREDISKYYGGSRIGYNTAYSTSNNAYMLVYRQIDKERNVLPMSKDEFPEHIKEMLQNLDDKSEYDMRLHEKARELCKIKVFAHHPLLDRLIDCKIECAYNTTLQDITELAYKKLSLNDIAELEQCRLVMYDSGTEIIEGSLEGKEEASIGSILTHYSINIRKAEMYVDIKAAGTQFEVLKQGTIFLRVHLIDDKKMVVKNVRNIRTNLSRTVQEFEADLYALYNQNESTELHIYFRSKVGGDQFVNATRPMTLKENGFYPNARVFVCFWHPHDKYPSIRYEIRHMVITLDRNVRVKVCFPKHAPNDVILLKEEEKRELQQEQNMLRDSMEEKDEFGAKAAGDANGEEQEQSVTDDVLPMEMGISGNGLSHHSDHSTSEESSLTDSDRTIIGDSQDEENNACPCHEPEKVSSENAVDKPKNASKYFKLRQNDIRLIKDTMDENGRMLYLEVDREYVVNGLKLFLAIYTGVPLEYMKLFDSDQFRNENRGLSASEMKTLTGIKPDDTIHVKIERANEVNGKLFLLDMKNPQNSRYMLNWKINIDHTVADTKKNIVKKIFQVYNHIIPFERCRLRRKMEDVPGKIFLNDQVWKDLDLCNNWEMYVQPLSEDDPFEDPIKQHCIFIRKFNGSNAEDMEPINEIIINRLYSKEIAAKIAKHSGIPNEYLELGKDTTHFTQTDEWGRGVNVEWSSSNLSILALPSNIAAEGCLIYYRDNREPSSEPRTVRARVLSTSKKERSLRIHVDKPTMG